MIRRRAGEGFALIQQVDHARVARALAEQIGTSRFQKPSRFAAFRVAVGEHDSGWGVHDDSPQLNARGLPLDVFEMPLELDLRCWAGAPEAAGRAGPWAELLVSLHVLNLSGIPAGHGGHSAPERFALNKFQHREMERQERLRRELGLSLDVPLTLGLAPEGTSAAEDEVRCGLRWLQAMDLISLAACCEKVPVDLTPEVHGRAGEQGEALRFRRDGDDVVVSPWPFGVERIRLEIPARHVRARAYASAEELRLEIASAHLSSLVTEVRPY